MRKIILLAALGVLVSATSASAQATIATGRHDLSASTAGLQTTALGGQTCVFCHTPHSGLTTVPLWNRTAPLSTYQLYASTTLDSATPTLGAVRSSVSGACLSCHDGTIGMDVLLNFGGVARPTALATFTATGAKATYSTQALGNLMTGNVGGAGGPFLGLDLRNDHPITMIYETARAATSTEFVLQVITGSKITVGASLPLPLFGSGTATATVECGSCHNPHSNINAPFLRKSNANSAICLSCHVK